MNRYERVLAVLNGEILDRQPVGVHGWEVAARESGYFLREFCTNGEKMAKAQIAFQKRYNFDIIHLENGVGPLAEAMGCQVVYPKNEPPVVTGAILSHLEDVDKLRLPNPYKDGKLPEILKATRLVKKVFDDEVFIIGEADQGPFNLAAQLRGIERFLIDLTKEENFEPLQELLKKTTEAVLRYARAQIENGAHATCIGESFASPDVISPEYYRKFAFPYEKELGSFLEEDKVIWALHICGDTTKILKDMNNTKASILEIDYKTDLEATKEKIKNSTILGTINPMSFLKSPEDVKKEAKKNIKLLGGSGRFILSSGCVLSSKTPSKNIHALLEVVEEYGEY